MTLNMLRRACCRQSWSVVFHSKNLAAALSPQILSKRNTWMLRRKYRPKQSQPDSMPNDLENPDFIYEELGNTADLQKPPLDVIMIGDAPEIGLRGDMIKVSREVFRYYLYPAGLAVYKTEDTLKEFAALIQKRADPSLPQQTVSGYTTINALRHFTLDVTMNRYNPWTVDKSMVCACFQKAGFVVPESCVTIPENPPITSENPQPFHVSISVNGIDSVSVPCRISLCHQDEPEHVITDSQA